MIASMLGTNVQGLAGYAAGYGGTGSAAGNAGAITEATNDVAARVLGQFGITEQESHVLRDYIQSKADTGREYIELLHKEFPEFMDKENERYVDDVNTERKMQGLMPLHL